MTWRQVSTRRVPEGRSDLCGSLQVGPGVRRAGRPRQSPALTPGQRPAQRAALIQYGFIRQRSGPMRPMRAGIRVCLRRRCSLPGGGSSNEAFGFGECRVPGVAGNEFAACMRLVRLDAAGAEQDVDAFSA